MRDDQSHEEIITEMPPWKVWLVIVAAAIVLLVLLAIVTAAQIVRLLEYRRRLNTEDLIPWYDKEHGT